MRLRLTLISAGALLLAGAAAKASALSLPDWVAQAAATPTAEHSSDARAIVLLEDKMISVQSDGRAVERYRLVVKILRPRGREDAEPSAQFSKDAKLHSFHVWSIGPDGHQYTMKEANTARKATKKADCCTRMSASR
jgi:hypothetical protein